jgi:8-oxo-dGTP diphosphatase
MSRSHRDSVASSGMKKKRKAKARRRSILAAGGIVTRGRSRPLVAVVQLRRQKTWMLPKGKLSRDETARHAAKREAVEETGHDVSVHEYLGSLSYITGGRPKIVKFWRMQAGPKPVSKLMNDVRAVRWLPLGKAIRKLTHERERIFLQRFGTMAVQAAAGTPSDRRKKAGKRDNPPPARRNKPAKAPGDSSSAGRAKIAIKEKRKPGGIARVLFGWLRR